MQYIVLDMEWNQPWPGSPSAQKVLPVAIHGEIIQIGAVRVSEHQTILDEYQRLILPKYYKHLNKRVSSLTGIKESRLREEGRPFSDVMAEFRKWCGKDCIFLTWGFDDIRILKENMELYGLNSNWVDRWYNAQLFFNAQTDGSTSQKALKTAMELFNITPTRKAHDALGDAFHTAIICTRLDLKKGMREYRSAEKKHEEGLHGADNPDCLGRKVFHGYADKDAVLTAMGTRENVCPRCRRKMRAARWIAQPGHRYMTLSTCARHGEFLMRIRLVREDDGKFRVSRLLYAGDSEAAETYRARVANLPPEKEPEKKPVFFWQRRRKPAKRTEKADR